MPDAPTPTDPTTAEGKVFAPVSGGNTPAPLPSTSRGGLDRVLNQIEGAADYYSPDTYRGLLTYYSSIKLYGDPNEDFVPVSQTKPNPKLFVVGIIPPSARISGRTLDRSASVSAVTGTPTQQLDFSGPSSQAAAYQSNSSVVTASGYTVKKGSGKASKIAVPPGTIVPPREGDDRNPKYTNLSTPQVWAVLEQAYRESYGRDPTPTELQLYTAQVLRETGGGAGASLPNNNFGYVGNHGKNPVSGAFLAVDGKYYNSYPDTLTGAKAFLKNVASASNVQSSAAEGDTLGYLTSLAQNGYFEDSVQHYYSGNGGRFPALLGQVSRSMKGYGVTLDDGAELPDHAPNCCAFNETNGQYQSRVVRTTGQLKANNNFRFKSGSPYGDACPLEGTGPQDQSETNSDWIGQGSANATAAKKEEAKVEDTSIDLNQTGLGQKFLQKQSLETALTSLLLDNMRNTPPLRLLVNPVSFKISSEKIVSDGNWTRSGPIVEHWGDQLDKVETNGKVAAFLAIDANSPDINFEGGPGLTRVARQYSASYQNFLALYLLYRSNGYLFTAGLDNGDGREFFNRLSLVGSIYIYYDSTLYIGSFDNFNITENDTAPYSLEYNFAFTARATFLLDRPDEYDYGEKKLFFGQPSLVTSSDALEASVTQGTGVERPGDVALPPGATVTDSPSQEELQRYPWLQQKPSQGDQTIDPAVLKATQPPTGQVVPKPTAAQRAGKK
jgi:hypothetical protein